MSFLHKKDLCIKLQKYCKKITNSTLFRLKIGSARIGWRLWDKGGGEEKRNHYIWLIYPEQYLSMNIFNISYFRFQGSIDFSSFRYNKASKYKKHISILHILTLSLLGYHIPILHILPLSLLGYHIPIPHILTLSLLGLSKSTLAWLLFV